MKDFLKSTRFFSSISDEKLVTLSSRMKRHSYCKNQSVFTRGEVGEFLGFIISGKLKVSVVSESGRELVLDYLEPGNCVGEMSLFGDGKRSADVWAAEPSVIAMISNKDYLALTQDEPSVMYMMAALISKRLSNTNNRVESIASCPLKKRFVDFLLSCCERSEDYVVSYTHQQIADMLGANRESISRIFADMKNNGILMKEKGIGRFRVIKSKLRKMSEEM